MAVLEISDGQDPRTEVQSVFGQKYSRFFTESNWIEAEHMPYYPLGYVYL